MDCPNCGQDDCLATVETVRGYASIFGIDERGEFEYAGDTMVDWDSSETVTDPLGRPLLHCEACGFEWVYTGGPHVPAR